MSEDLSSVCALITDCEHRTAAPEPDGIYPLIRTPDVGLGRLHLDRAQRVGENTYREWTRRARPQARDLILAREAPVGNVGIVPDGVQPVLGQRTVLIRADETRVDAMYLNYLLSGPNIRAWMDGVATGATVPHLNVADIRSMRLPALPPLPTQRKIAAILSAYDDLVENNNRRIKILEEMARRIYREWFVDYRYPGHEKVPQMDSELGPVPKGWVIAPIGDYALVQRGRSYRGSDVVDDGGVPFVNLKCVARDGGFRPDGLKRYVGEFKASHQVRPGEIVMAITDMTQERRIVARAARVPPFGQEFGVFSMDLVKIVAKGVPPEYLYGMLRYSTFADEVKAHANGANVLHLHPDRITSFRGVVPPRGLMERYAELLSPMDSLGDRLGAAQSRLRAARDLLLPRLVSGEIDVDDLDIQVPDAA